TSLRSEPVPRRAEGRSRPKSDPVFGIAPVGLVLAKILAVGRRSIRVSRGARIEAGGVPRSRRAGDPRTGTGFGCKTDPPPTSGAEGPRVDFGKGGPVMRFVSRFRLALVGLALVAPSSLAFGQAAMPAWQGQAVPVAQPMPAPPTQP